MSFAPTKIVKFIRREISTIAEEGPVTQFKLFHCSNEDIRSPMGEFPVIDGMDPEELAQEIADHAQQHCDTMVTTRSERYGLESWIEARGSIRDHIIFLMTCNNPLSSSIEPTEPSTEKGIVAQLMRQNEKKDQLLMGMFGHVTSSYGQLLTFVNTGVQLRTEAADDRFTNLKQKMEYEQFLNQQEMEKLRERTAIESKGQLIEMVKPAFGMLMGQVASSFVKRGVPTETPKTKTETPVERSDIFDLLDIVGEAPSLAMVSGLSNQKLKSRIEIIIDDYFHPTKNSSPTNWNIATLLDSAGYDESIKMAQSTGNEAVEVMMTEYINNHFKTTGVRPQTSSESTKEQDNGKSKEEDHQAQEQGPQEAEQRASEEDASGPSKVPSGAKQTRKRNRKRTQEAPKEVVKKEGRKAPSKANGKVNKDRRSPQEAKRTKANSRWSKTHQ
jgi:hypothetical protein